MIGILTDMFGGTPSDLAISVMQNRTVEVIAGVNLPMLVKLGRVRGDLALADAVALAQEAGRKYITVANSIAWWNILKWMVIVPSPSN